MTWDQWRHDQKRVADREALDQMAVEGYQQRVQMDCERDPELAWRMGVVNALSAMGFRYEWEPDRHRTLVGRPGVMMPVPDGFLDAMMDSGSPPPACAYYLAAVWSDPRLAPWGEDDADDLRDAA